MRNTLRRAALLLAAAIVSSGAGCTMMPAANSANTTTTTTTTNSANTTTTAAAPAPPPASNNANDAANMPLTMPVLDAFFADDSFSRDLKSKLNLSDEQVNKLRAVAREQTSALRESDSDDYAGTTAAASKRASEEINNIIGPEKADQLAAFVRTRWSGGGDEPAQNAAGNNDANSSNNRNDNTTNSSNPNNANDTSKLPGVVMSSGTPSGKVNNVPADTRIVVNAPAYRMDVFDNGRLVKSYKVGIGYPEFPLPQGLRKANTIIFNPSWTPPDSPWVEGKVKPGEKVEPGSKLNPLGPIKIPIGLPSLIHGGKSPAKLGSFASHGCVGLTNNQVQAFARQLAEVSGTPLSDEQVAGFQKNRNETKNVKLTNPVPVELRYETIVVEDGNLHIYRDVYDKGTNTEEKLRAVLSSYGVSFDQLSDQERAQIRTALTQMSRDANGNAAGDDNKNDNTTGKNNRSKNGNTGVKVTRAIKGRKEIVIPIAALAGKGYPAPADLDTGGAPQGKATGTTRASSKKRR